MALSEQEQKVLREIEAQLYADDPMFAGSIRRSGGMGAKAIALGLVGVVFLVGGMALLTISKYFMILSIVGFLVMFATGIWVLRGSGAGEARPVNSLSSASKDSRMPRPGRSGNDGISKRMEDNFRKRFDN